MTSIPATSSASDATTASRRPPGRPRDARADRAILGAALHELTQHGYAGLSMDKVAARAGVSKATIYRRWSSREDLILDAWRSIPPVHTEDAPDTGHLRTDLDHLCNDYREAFGAEMRELLPQMIAAVHQSPQLAELFSQFVTEQMQPLYRIYARAKERGQLRADVDVEQAASLIAGSLFFNILFRGELMSADDLRHAVSCVLDGILAD